jgi:protein-disulfide isomerase
MEEENVDIVEIVPEVEQPAASSKQNLAIPAAIVIAGLAIAAAIFFGGKGGASPAAPGGAANNGPVTVDPVTSSDHILGNPNAKVMIVEYSDLECPFCKSFQPTIQRIMDEYGKDGKIAVAYRHFPLPFHTKSPHEAEAAECANKLGGNDIFWKYITKIYEITPANNGLDPAELDTVAKGLGLNMTAFDKCLSSGEMKAVITKDMASGTKAGLQGTPYSVILVNKKVVDTINGAQPYESVKAQVEAALAK